LTASFICIFFVCVAPADFRSEKLEHEREDKRLGKLSRRFDAAHKMDLVRTFSKKLLNCYLLYYIRFAQITSMN
jgi:hypothetical protein